MSQITEVRINKFELKRSDTDDPVAQKVRWDPARSGGANFRTHKLNVTPMRISVARSRGLKAFAALFMVVGAVPVAIGIAAARDGEIVGAAFALLMGGVFVAIGVATLSKKNLLTFDRAQGVYYRGGQYVSAPIADRHRQGFLSDIHALQLLSETVSGTKGGSYTSHELNLVLRDGERLNVMDHGDGAEIENSAKVLAGFLGVPVWQAVY